MVTVILKQTTVKDSHAEEILVVNLLSKDENQSELVKIKNSKIDFSSLSEEEKGLVNSFANFLRSKLA